MERVLAWYRVGSSYGAVIALVVANAIPLIGVLFLGWSVWNILVIYWLENGIVGGFNVLKIARAQGPDESLLGRMTISVNGRPASAMAKAALIPFFCLHYGLFWVVHGVFVLMLPLFAGMSDQPLGSSMTLSAGSILFAVIALAVSHGLSFWLNFLRGGEYRRVTAAGQMFAPYRRLIALHLTIIFGAMAILVTGAPAAAIAVLVAVKIALDLGLHLAEHRPRGATGAVIAG
jgi:hypothetical protein